MNHLRFIKIYVQILFTSFHTVFLCIALLYCVGFFTHACIVKKTMYGDGMFYYSWLRSALIDHDMDFTDEYSHFAVRQPFTSAGFFGNKYTIGPALLWTPFFLITHSIVRGDGWTFAYDLTVGITSLFAALFGLLLLWRVLPGSERTKIWTIILVAFATNLLFYGSLDIVNSHAISFFAACVFVSLLLTDQPNWFAVGLSLGYMSIVREQDLILSLLLLLYWKKIRWIPLVLGLFIFTIPQQIVRYLLYGSLANPYITSEGFIWPPHIITVLFSRENGLFLWTPVVLIGVIGLFFWHKKYLARSMIAGFITELFIVASWSTYTQGGSYSGRMFVSILPFVAFGLATIIETISKKSSIIANVIPVYVVSLCAINIVSIVNFLLSH
jgi:hypothetical protein